MIRLNWKIWEQLLKSFHQMSPVLHLHRKVLLWRLKNSRSFRQQTLPFMITNLLPAGVVGLLAAAMLSALMSTVAGALNSISTLFSYDLYKRFRPDTSDRRLVFVGRLRAGVALVAAIGLVPLFVLVRLAGKLAAGALAGRLLVPAAPASLGGGLVPHGALAMALALSVQGQVPRAAAGLVLSAVVAGMLASAALGRATSRWALDEEMGR